MAYVAEDEDTQNDGQPVQLSEGGATLNTQKGGSGPGQTQAPDTSGSPAKGGNPSSSGNFTNLQSYLDANMDGASNLGNTLSGSLNKGYQDAFGNVLGQRGQFSTQVVAGTDQYNPDLIKSATTDPTSFLSNSDSMQQLAKMKAGQYTGPSAFENSQYGTAAQTSVTNAQQQASLAGTAGGREELLRQANPNTQYSNGGLGLDQFLVQGSPGALNQVTTAASRAGGLTDLFNDTQKAADNNVATAQKTSANTGTQTTTALNGAVSDYRTQIDNAVDAATKQQQQQFTDLQNSLSPQQQQTAALKSNATTSTPALTYNVSDAQLGQMGVTRDQWNQLVQLNNQSLAQGNQGISLSSYLNNTPGQFTEGSVATPEQQAFFNALNQVAGSGLSLNGGGTAGGSQYDLESAYNALLAQLQAKAPTGVTGGTNPTTGGTAATAAGAAGVAGLVNQISNLLKNQAQQPKVNTQQIGQQASQTANGIGNASVAPILTGVGAGLGAGLPISGAASGAGAGATGSVTVTDASGIPYSFAGNGGLTTVGAGAGSGISTVGADGIQDLGVDNVQTLGSVEDSLGTGSGGLSVGNALGALGAIYGLYNFGTNWKSGNYGSNALNGAAAGAAIGSVVPIVGTALGAIIGGAVGAISSAFGPGKKDPEVYGWQALVDSTAKTPGAGLVINNPFILMAGMFDERSSTVPIYQKYGRAGENKFTVDMTQQINNAFHSGAINSQSTPQQVYDSVVMPWVASMGNWNNVGPEYKESISELLMNMTGQYMAGQTQNWKTVGGSYAFTGGSQGSIIPYGQSVAAPTQTVKPVMGGVNRGTQRL
jgi:hypothetical protein